jgi:hypothetical protein
MPASAMSDEEKEAIWWRKGDLDLFRGRAQLLADEFARRGESHDPKGFTKVFLNSHLSCCNVDGPNAEQRHYSKQWIKAVSSLRGIEHLCIPELAEVKADGKCKTIRAVLDAQDCCSNTMSQDQRVDFIMSVSECRSLGARNFARLLGDCDAYAAAEDEVSPVQQQLQTKPQTIAATLSPSVVLQRRQANPKEAKNPARKKNEKYATIQFVNKRRKSLWVERPQLLLRYRRAKVESNNDY